MEARCNTSVVAEMSMEWLNPASAFMSQFDLNTDSVPSSQHLFPFEFGQIVNDDSFDTVRYILPLIQSSLQLEILEFQGGPNITCGSHHQGFDCKCDGECDGGGEYGRRREVRFGAELPLISKSNVGLFVEVSDLLEHLDEYSEFVGDRKVAMKIRVGVYVKDERMLQAMPEAAKIWMGVTKSMGKGCRQEFSKAFVKLLYAHDFLPNEVCFRNKGLDPFPGRWSSISSQKPKSEPTEAANRKR
ncbi:hypothetical protein R1sor_024251 [Riccia sorocarpa]|uniref:Uncharacterized protein n=1 Tax=Riccia sorocarpa TaxID=122646 RepID=A0ABD3GT73_9MARC